jgi:hypothetical protein
MLRSGESPGGGECIGRFFDVEYFAPWAISEIRMREFMRDYVMSELLGADGELESQHHTATAAAWWPGRRHPQSPAFFGRIVVESDPKPGIIQKITLHVLGQTVQHGQDATFQIGMISEIFQQGGEDLSYLSKRKPCIFRAKQADCRR